MCSIIGIVFKNPTKDHFKIIRDIFKESGIRGRHATGLSCVVNDKIQTFKEAVPVERFVHLDNLEEMVNDDGVLSLIGHCRYSTSDLEFTQPIYDENLAIVHNGVVTQELPENWETLYGYKCETRNDSELLLHTINQANYPLEFWPQSSMAVCELHKNGSIRFYRNGKRPLWFNYIMFNNEVGGYVITSTSDISIRAGLNCPVTVPCGEYITIDKNLCIDATSSKIKSKDLQKYD